MEGPCNFDWNHRSLVGRIGLTKALALTTILHKTLDVAPERRPNCVVLHHAHHFVRGRVADKRTTMQTLQDFVHHRWRNNDLQNDTMELINFGCPIKDALFETQVRVMFVVPGIVDDAIVWSKAFVFELLFNDRKNAHVFSDKSH